MTDRDPAGNPPDMPLRSIVTGDGRRRPVKTFRRLRRQLIADLGEAESIPATKLCVIETLGMAVAAQREEFAQLIDDPTRDPSRFASLGNLVLGSARTLGLTRVPKSVPSLHEYLAQRAAQDAQQDAQDARSGAGDAEVAAPASDAQRPSP